jgi:hypothetical protein
MKLDSEIRQFRGALASPTDPARVVHPDPLERLERVSGTTLQQDSPTPELQRDVQVRLSTRFGNQSERSDG